MKLQDIKNLEYIIKSNYSENGVWLEDLWTSIYNFNLDFTVEQTFEALISTLRFLLNEKRINLKHRSSSPNNKIIWEGDTETILNMLKAYLKKFTLKDTENNPEFLELFEYPIIEWIDNSPFDIKKFQESHR